MLIRLILSLCLRLLLESTDIFLTCLEGKKREKKKEKKILTFILKKVILVKRSTVDLRSCSLSGLLAGKLF